MLAKRGKRVLILEGSASIGGPAATHEFAPGFRASTAHLMHLMPRSLVAALGLEQHGLKFAASNMATTSLSPAGNHLQVTPESVAAASPADAAAYPAFLARMNRLAGALRPMLASVPPRLGTDAWSDRIALLKLGWQVRRLGRKDMRELLRIIGMNAYDLCTDYLNAPLLQGALAFDATLGGNLGPRAPGTVLPWLVRLAMQGSEGNTGLAFVRQGGRAPDAGRPRGALWQSRRTLASLGSGARSVLLRAAGGGRGAVFHSRGRSLPVRCGDAPRWRRGW